MIETDHGKVDVFAEGRLRPTYNFTRHLRDPDATETRSQAEARRAGLRQVGVYEDATEFYLRSTNGSHNISIMDILTEQSK